MKKLLLIFVFVLSVGPAFAIEQGMNETGKAFIKAFLANDLDAIMALYAPDAVVFPPDMMVAKGTAEIRKSFAAMLNSYTVKDFTVIEAEHETVGDLSFSRGLFRLTLAGKSGEPPMTMEGRSSDVCKKINGKWLYIIDHASMPLPPPPPAAAQPHH